MGLAVQTMATHTPAFAGPFQGSKFLVAVDAHLKWPEVYAMSSTTVEKTTEVLHHIFAAYAIPEQVVMDNGPQFAAEACDTFMKKNGIRHICTIPYHPASNGLAERFIQSFKQALQAAETMDVH